MRTEEMPMNFEWSAEACERPLPDNDEELSFRFGLLMATGELGLGTLTEENLSEWMFRINYRPCLALEWFTSGPETQRQEIEARLRRWLALRTNRPTLPREEWLARIRENPEGEDEAERED